MYDIGCLSLGICDYFRRFSDDVSVDRHSTRHFYLLRSLSAGHDEYLYALEGHNGNMWRATFRGASAGVLQAGGLHLRHARIVHTAKVKGREIKYQMLTNCEEAS